MFSSWVSAREPGPGPFISIITCGRVKERKKWEWKWRKRWKKQWRNGGWRWTRWKEWRRMRGKRCVGRGRGGVRGGEEEPDIGRIYEEELSVGETKEDYV